MTGGATVEVCAWMAGAVAVGVLWQGAIVGGLGAAVLAAMRRATPQARYAVACATLAALLLLIPINLATIDAPAPPPQVRSDVALPYFSGAGPSDTLPEGRMPNTADAAPRQDETAALRTNAAPASVESANIAAAPRELRPQPGQIDWYDRAMPWLGKAWWLGVLFITLYDLMGLIALRRLRAGARPAPDAIIAMAERVRLRLGIKADIPVCIAEGTPTALVVGIMRAVILLPASMASGMAPAYVEAILAHEMAHIRRWDRWVNLLQRFVEALLFFHPAVWWISRIARTERELCCDEIALQVCPDRPQYVRALLTLSELAQPYQTFALSSHGGSLAHRVRHILDVGRIAQYRYGRAAGALGGAVIAVVPLALALIAHAGTGAHLPERILHFPGDRMVGTVYGRWSDVDFRAYPWMPGHNEGWTMLALARGDVKVPENTQVKLNVAGTDLSFLRMLEVDAIYFLDLSFSGVNDADLVPVAALSGLRALDLSDNEQSMTGAALGALGGLHNLEWLDLERTSLADLPAGALAGLQNLQYLAGHFDEHADRVLFEASALANLEFLSLKGGAVSESGLRAISPNMNLRGLALDNVALGTEEFFALEAMPGLNYLDIRKNPISDEAMAHLRAFPDLKYLNIERTSITDGGIEHLYGNETIEQIYLFGTSVTDACLDILATMPALKMANLGKTGVDDFSAGAFTAGLVSLSDSNSLPQQSSNPEAPRVGLVFSHATATSPHVTTQTSGYFLQDSLVLARALNEANFDVYAVVEPGTEFLGELPWLLHTQGLETKVVDGYDPASLAALDVLFAATLYDAPVPLLEAIGQAVEQGMGLVNVGSLGVAAPGEQHPAVERLTGLDQSAIYWQAMRDVVAPIIRPHPILGALKPGNAFVLTRLDGCNSDSGILHDGTVLIDAPPEYPGDYPVLYTRTLGRGRIVRAQWHRPFHPGIPYPGFSFYVRAINWTAYRDAGRVW